MINESDKFEGHVSGEELYLIPIDMANGCASGQILEQTQVLIHPHTEDFIELSSRLRRRCPVSFDTAKGRWQPLVAGGF